MPVIRFSDEYPKLHNHNFNTFRGYSANKHRYYQNNIGEVFDVVVKEVPSGWARLLQIGFAWAADVTLDEIKEDTFPQYTQKDWNALMRKFYGMTNPFGIWLYFERVELRIGGGE